LGGDLKGETSLFFPRGIGKKNLFGSHKTGLAFTNRALLAFPILEFSRLNRAPPMHVGILMEEWCGSL
jgi:hypothetical protein